MPPDETSHNSEDGGAGSGPPHSPEWWGALRRVVARLLDAAEAAAVNEGRFRDDLARIFDAWPGGAFNEPAPAAEAEQPVLEAPTAAPEIPSLEARGVTPAAAPPVIAPPPAPPPSPPATLSAPEPLPPLVGPREVSTSGGTALTELGRAWGGEAVFDPQGIADRCRLKAEACRWQSERRRLLDDGADVSDGDRALASRGHQLGVRLWMTSPIKWREKTDDAFLTVAACYDALAESAEAMALADQAAHEQDSALVLLAEAQSALRAAVEGYASTSRDEDQEAVFAWLRQETDARRVFVRFMQRDHPASPDDHEVLRRRVAELRRRLEDRTNRSRQIGHAIKKLGYQVRKLADAAAAAEAVNAGHPAVRAIAATAEGLLALGIPPSDPRLREALLNVAAQIPLDVPPPLSRVMEAVDEYLDHLGEEDDGAAADNDEGDRPNDALVNEARNRVAGRRAVMLGGMPNEPARLKLERGLGLEELQWLRVEHHEPFDRAAHAISRPGVGLVIILTRWRSHRDGPAARNLCRERGIPLVEQPAGYNLRQVANQICRQFFDSGSAAG